MKRGLRCCCPHCGQGRLFQAYLKISDKCSVCDQDFSKADSADGPAFFIMFVVGFIIVIGVFIVERSYAPPLWVHAVLWGPLTFGLSFLLLQPFKGLWIAVQFYHRAEEARFSDGDHS